MNWSKWHIYLTVFVCISGSNCVNVFLGLGIPWVLSAMYHLAKGTEFKVQSDNLTQSVIIFSSVGALCIIILLIRRKVSYSSICHTGEPFSEDKGDFSFQNGGFCFPKGDIHKQIRKRCLPKGDFYFKWGTFCQNCQNTPHFQIFFELQIL